MPRQRGYFIVLEGGDGAGKSSQARALATLLKSKKIKTVLTREVGGSPGAEAIRDLWLHGGDTYQWDQFTELMLIMAARRDHLAKTVWPALKKGQWVISDRFLDSTLVYQGAGQGLGTKVIMQAYQLIASAFQPDLVIVLDVPPQASAKRMKERSLDRFERNNAAFHQKIRQGFLRLAKKYPRNHHVIDASQPLEQVTQDLLQAVTKRFKLKI